MVLEIQEADGRLKITAKHEIDWPDVTSGVVIFTLGCWESIRKLKLYPFPVSMVAILFLLALGQWISGDQLEVVGTKLIHRISLFGIRLRNRSFDLKNVLTMGFSFRRRWFGLLPDNSGLLMKFEDCDLYFGHRMEQSDVAEILRAIEQYRTLSSNT